MTFTVKRVILHDLMHGKRDKTEEINVREIDRKEGYAFALRYSDDEGINGEMAGRLVGIYAISKDGMEIYHYSLVNDIWE